MTDKIFCDNCGWQGDTETVLIGKNPFAPDLTIYGCPKCKEIEQFTAACDIEGCWEQVTAGTPTDGGYKRLCSKHYGEEIKKQSGGG